MTEDERNKYWRGLENEAIDRDVARTAVDSAEAKVRINAIRRMLALGLPKEQIAQVFDLRAEEVDEWARDTKFDNDQDSPTTYPNGYKR